MFKNEFNDNKNKIFLFFFAQFIFMIVSILEEMNTPIVKVNNNINDFLSTFKLIKRKIFSKYFNISKSPSPSTFIFSIFSSQIWKKNIQIKNIYK